MLNILKRPRESLGSENGSQLSQPDCSPHRQAMLECSPGAGGKRLRAQSSGDAMSTPTSQFLAAVDSGASSSQQQPLADISAQLRQRVDPHTGEVLFTLDSVKDIVRRAVDEKERSLREQYDRILQQKLQEQYQAFAKFNEDYISRSLKSSDLAYVS